MRFTFKRAAAVVVLLLGGWLLTSVISGAQVTVVSTSRAALTPGHWEILFGGTLPVASLKESPSAGEQTVQLPPGPYEIRREGASQLCQRRTTRSFSVPLFGYATVDVKLPLSCGINTPKQTIWQELKGV